MNFLGAIGFNLRNLANFRGRDPRSRFWPYAIIIIVLSSIAAAKVMMPELMSSIERTHRFAIENPDKATIEQSSRGVTIHLRGFYPELMPRIDRFMPGLGGVFLVTIALLAAATARRLHDCGRTAAWMGLPIALLASSFLLMYRLLSLFMSGEFEFSAINIALFIGLLINNLAYLGSLLFLVAMLTKPSQSGETLYGPEPTSLA